MRLLSQMATALFGSLTLMLSSCNHCPDGLEVFDFPPYMERYFGVYRPGSYFIFLNQDSTERDSMYISDFHDGFSLDKEVACEKYPFKRFMLNSEHLSASPKVEVYFVSATQAYNFYGESDSLDRFWEIRYAPGSEEFWAPTVYPFFLHDTFILWGNSQNVVYDVWEYPDNENGNIYFAPDIGIVKYISIASTDTFTITEVFVQ